MDLERHFAAFACVGATVVLAACLSGAEDAAADAGGATLPGTSPLTFSGDMASEIVAGADRFLLREIERSIARRGRWWKRDLSSREKYAASVEANRARLAHILGVRDPRVTSTELEITGGPSGPAVLAEGDGYQVYAARWPVFGGVSGEGLLLVPAKPSADVVAIPDAGQTPEQICGLAEGVPPEAQFARRLAESGFRVLVPVLIDRRPAHEKLTRREFLYRSAFELGRHLIGYEVQKVLAAVDRFSFGRDPRVAVAGHGEGGLIALYAAALDPRIQCALVSGYFDSRQEVWREPIDRNVFGLLDEFGDAEIASLIAPRALIVEAARGPQFEIPPGTGGAPAKLETPRLESVRREVERARKLEDGLQPGAWIELVASGDGTGPPGSPSALSAFIVAFQPLDELAAEGSPPRRSGASPDPEARQLRQFQEIDRHNQWLLGESAAERKKFFSRLDTSSLEKFAGTIEWYRDYFRDEVVGRFEQDLLPPDPRARKVYDEPKFTGYEVVLDVFPDVPAYGILLVPKGIGPGERRPVVVCQHGLEGRPQDVADPKNENQYYHRFACQLAERGFVTFAPQNLYIFGDRFRALQRKANPLGKTLFSIIVPQHQAITDWLKSLPYVDPARIGFYGLSYGGKSAMRIPPLVKNYCLSICSADFNEWVWKNASSRSSYSYVFTGEYEIFEWDLGSTFNYAEMAALIAPRPFMVERGHFDGVAPDEAVGYEFAKVRFLYEAKLGIGDRAEIEWFVGPHTINGKGTFEFLERHLKWPPR